MACSKSLYEGPATMVCYVFYCWASATISSTVMFAIYWAVVAALRPWWWGGGVPTCATFGMS